MQTFGALLLSPADTDKLRAVCLPEGQANKKLVGKSPSAMLEAAGIAVPAKAPRLLIALVNADESVGHQRTVDADAASGKSQRFR
ncbi:aldehyde dehydrogenase [Salmonella enterica subsp. enterica serovar Typhimurium]|nr:aldehyde dehydrogenase [Salmonella enterica subsp. enterica serovar Typhimurium]